jgi:acyl-CoA thioesterase
MTTPNILTDTSPTIDRDDPTLVRSVITDAWGLFFAQGGVVMAAALRAMDVVLGRGELSLASASAVFCRPVACGPVTTQVEILRNGRSGAQVRGSLRDQNTAEGEMNVSITAVFTDINLPGPKLAVVPRPLEFLRSPDPNISETDASGDEFPLGFLNNTEWRMASGPDDVGIGDESRVAVWFRFNDPPAPRGEDWSPALLPIPGDALGSALAVALAGGDEPVGSVSLQIDIQFFAPIQGTWIGIESMVTNVDRGLAGGYLHLWSESGDHVATVTQTAMLRSIGD